MARSNKVFPLSNMNSNHIANSNHRTNNNNRANGEPHVLVLLYFMVVLFESIICNLIRSIQPFKNILHSITVVYTLYHVNGSSVWYTVSILLLFYIVPMYIDIIFSIDIVAIIRIIDRFFNGY